MRRLLVVLLVFFCLWLPGATQEEPNPAAVEHLLGEAWFTLRSGDYSNCRQIYKFLGPIEHLKNPPELWHVFLGPDALAPLYLDYGEGKFTKVLESAPAAREAARARKDTSRELEILLLAIASADDCGRPAEVMRLLPEAEALASAAPGARGALSRYVLYTLRATYLNEAHPFTVEEARKRVLEASALLAGLKFDEDYRRNALVEPLLARDAFKFWMRRLTARGLYDELFAQYRSLYPPLLEGARQDCPEDSLNQLSAYQLLRCTQSEAFFAMVSRAAILGTFTPEKAYGFIDPVLKDCEDEYAEFGQMAEKESLLIVWYRGPISRSLAIGHLDRASITMERLRENPDQVPAEERFVMGDHLFRALEVAQKAGDAEVRTRAQLAYLEALFRAEPDGWEHDADLILGKLEPSWSQNPSKIFAYIQILLLRGKIRARQKRNSEAIEALSKAIHLIEAYAQESGSSTQLASDWKEEYELLARLQLESGKPAEAADTLDRQGQLSTISAFPLRSLNKPELRSATELQQKMVGLTQQAGAGDAQAVQLLAQTRSEFYQTLADLQKREPAYARLTVRPNNFSRLQPVLPEDTVVIQLFPAEDKLYLFVATREALKIRSVPVKSARLEELTAKFRRSVVSYGRASSSFDWASPAGTDLAATMVELGDSLWAPIESDLHNKKVVVFIPTGPLCYLPMQVLARPGTPRPHLLVEEKAVAVVAKSSDLESLQRPAKEGRTMLALADPDGSLAGARQEASDVARLFPGSEVCVGSEATADHLTGLKPDVGFVHLATHGMLDIAQPTDSYLLMAGKHDRLSVTEIAGLDLAPVRLVTLSACQSALAEKQPEVGADLTSLADAFAFAGSPTLVASLWKVSDTSTHSLMLEFYRQLASGKPQAEALREAQLSLLSRPETAHPFHWAAFELLGDWR